MVGTSNPRTGDFDGRKTAERNERVQMYTDIFAFDAFENVGTVALPPARASLSSFNGIHSTREPFDAWQGLWGVMGRGCCLGAAHSNSRCATIIIWHNNKKNFY